MRHEERAPLSFLPPRRFFGSARQVRLTVRRRLKSRRFLDKETAFPEIVDFPRGNVVYFIRGIISDILKAARSDDMLKEKIGEARAEEEGIKNVVFERETLSEEDVSEIEFENARFKKCRFEKCDFSKTSFYKTEFLNCIFLECIFSEGYFRDCRFVVCRGDGSNFCESVFKNCVFSEGSFAGADFSKSLWETCTLADSFFKGTAFPEVRFKKMTLRKVDFCGADFFRTPLKDMDLSDCKIEKIILSDTFRELKGAIVNPLQAAELVRLLGVKVV